MVEDLTVLLVGDDEPDEKLVEQLEKKNLAVEISSKKEFPSLLALVEPHIVIHTGKEGAERTASILKETEEVRRVRLVVLAPRDELSELRQLDKTVVVSLLATDIAPSVVAARVLMLAKKGPDKSGRPQSIAAKPPAREPAKAPGAPPSLPKAAPFTKPGAPPKPIIAEAKPPERPLVPSLGARPEG